LILKRTLEGNAGGEAKRAKIEGKKGSREGKSEGRNTKRKAKVGREGRKRRRGTWNVRYEGRA
jgi:hypothetical protein